MSERKLQKYLRRFTCTLPNHLAKTPVVITTSKGNYLKQECSEGKIVWCNRPGARTIQQLVWLERNLNNLVRDHGKLMIYIWLGTCDVTCKTGRYIDLRFPSLERLLSELKPLFDRYVTLCERNSQVSCCFLEIPQISVYEWNRSRNHPTPGYYKQRDTEVRKQIDGFNEFLHTLNERGGGGEGVAPKDSM